MCRGSDGNRLDGRNPPCVCFEEGKSRLGCAGTTLARTVGSAPCLIPTAWDSWTGYRGACVYLCVCSCESPSREQLCPGAS